MQKNIAKSIHKSHVMCQKTSAKSAAMSRVICANYIYIYIYMQIYTSCLLVRLLLSACTFDFQFCSILCSRLQSASFSCPGRCQTSLNVHELAPLSRRVSTSANGCANARACSCLAWFLLHNLKTTVAAQINLETCMHKELLHGFRRSQSEVPSIMSQISVRNADHIFTNAMFFYCLW